MIVQNISDFKVSPHYPYTPLLGKSVETGACLRGIFDDIAVKVPSNLYNELTRHGMIEDPRVGLNSLKCEWVSARWWLYDAEFIPQSEGPCKLVFEGVDYKCHVYLNGVKLGEHTGALTSFAFEVGDLLVPEKTNFLRVLVEHAPDEMHQIGYTERTRTQRQRFDYKWDFCTRMVNIGIYRPVRLEWHGGADITDFSFRTTDFRRCEGIVRLKVDGPASLRIEIFDKEQRVFEKETKVEAKEYYSLPVRVTGGQAWYPNGEGMPKVYRLVLETFVKGKPACKKEQIIGFRKIRLVQNENSPENSLSYTFEVNGKRIYARGFNVTPLDQMLGTETENRYRAILEAAAEAHANLIRVWGGGIIEQPIFYQICSELGLMVWQDMIQSSSGLSNRPSEDPEFLRLLAESVDQFARTRPNYPCTAVACGGNELFGEDGRPVTEENGNIRMIKEILKRKCPDLCFLPSTASGPVQEASMTRPEMNHDIHGPWLYLGENLYDHYNHLECLFAGEFGCNGMASVSQVRRILAEDEPEVSDMTGNLVWRHHGDWWDISRPLEELFGKIDSLDDFVSISQYLQAVGLYYGISRFRRQAFRQSGCLVWQLNEMWPMISCTTLIEYYGNRKPAYEAAKRAFDKVFLSFRFEKLAYQRGEKIPVSVYLTSEKPLGNFDVEICFRADGVEIGRKVQVVCSGEGKTVTVLETELCFPAEKWVEVEARTGTIRCEALFFIRDGKGLCDPALLLAKMKRREV